MSHTPGPWRVSDFGGNRIMVNATLHFSLVRVAVIHFGNYAWSAQHEANARLIAAAPELLDALDRLLYRSLMELADPEDVHEVAIARAVIAKATGESNG